MGASRIGFRLLVLSLLVGSLVWTKAISQPQTDASYWWKCLYGKMSYDYVVIGILLFIRPSDKDVNWRMLGMVFSITMGIMNLYMFTPFAKNIRLFSIPFYTLTQWGIYILLTIFIANLLQCSLKSLQVLYTRLSWGLLLRMRRKK